MARRSLKASDVGIIKIKQAIQKSGWTHEYLAAEVGLSTRNSVWKFVSGRNVSHTIFIELCFKLGLDWQDIVSSEKLNTSDALAEENLLNDDLLSELYVEIERQCSQMRSFSGNIGPLSVQQMYCDLKVSTSLSSQRWLEVEEVKFSKTKTVLAEEFVTSHSKVVILGKPGSGKTTLLKYLALQYQKGNYKSKYIPLFISLISLSKFAIDDRDNLVSNYIYNLLLGLNISREQLEELFNRGAFVIFLDGLDEVLHGNLLVNHIQEFADKFPLNKIVITCRNASNNYIFSGFDYVEIADFEYEQIEQYIHRWFSFAEFGDVQQEKLLLESLSLKEHQAILKLADRPILLNLICLIFQDNNHFPSKLYKLYEEAIGILLIKWDESRGIKRDSVNENLSSSELVKILSTIAEKTFVQGKYIFEKSDIINITREYFASNCSLELNKEDLLLYCENILKSIELHSGIIWEIAKGIFTFSHYIFQEYLIARKIVSIIDNSERERELANLAWHSLDPRWHEVIELTNSMLSDSHYLLEKINVLMESLLTQDYNLEKFISTIDEKIKVVKSNLTPAATKFFYISLAHDRDYNGVILFDKKIINSLSEDLALDLWLCKVLNISSKLAEKFSLEDFYDLCFALDVEHKTAYNPEFTESLKSFRMSLINLLKEKDGIEWWWSVNSQNWLTSLRESLIQYRSVGHDWQFNLEQQELLSKYKYIYRLYYKLLSHWVVKT